MSRTTCPTLPLPPADDYYYECEKMHGLEKTKIVAESLRKAVDAIEGIVKEVRQCQLAFRCS